MSKARDEFRREVFERNRAENGGRAWCVDCGKDKKHLLRDLVADHKNNDDTDNRIENGQVLCKSHNKKKDVSNILKALRDKDFNINRVYAKIKAQIKANRISMGNISNAKNHYGQEALFDWFEKIKLLPVEDFIVRGAAVANVQSSTVEKWYPVLCVEPEGRYRLREIKGEECIMLREIADDVDAGIFKSF